MIRRCARGIPYLLLALVLAAGATTSAQRAPAPGAEWRTYGGDLASTRYSPLDQITADNFKDLTIAWRFKTDNLGPTREFNFQVTPLMVNGVIYTTAGTRRSVVALSAQTGEQLWLHRIDEGKRGESAPRRLSGRGLAYWDDGGSGRIVYVTPGYLLVALDAKTGQQIPTFGTGGIVDLKDDLDQAVGDKETAEIGLHAAPIVVGGIVIVGAAHLAGGVPPTKEHIKGYIRGYDARTGKRLWTFHTIPDPGEFGNETWLNDSWAFTGNTGVWSQMSADETLGLVYLPVEIPTGDYYGGHRPGDNLFSASILALDYKTGKRVWHYQTTHHDVWDFDLPCAPVLVDITVDGRPIKAIAQPTKQGFLWVLDRTNGMPVWPVEERAVPQDGLPGETLSPTQPFPTKPPVFDLQGLSVNDLIDFTPELNAKARELVSKYRIGPLYTPPSARSETSLGTLMVPSATGGGNWPGGSVDPETGIFYIYSKSEVTLLSMINDPKRSNMNFINGGTGGEGGGALAVDGLPIVRPPWGRITAIDLNKGDIVWQIAHGETSDEVKNNPALAGVTIPKTGRPGRIGTLVTRTLVIAGEGGLFTAPNGQRGAMLRAYDKKTGAEVGAVYMPAPETGSPMTYSLNGAQYIVLAIGGNNFAGELIAFRLPPTPPAGADR
jgi:glucose dehydrogenase